MNLILAYIYFHLLTLTVKYATLIVSTSKYECFLFLMMQHNIKIYPQLLVFLSFCHQ